MLVLPDVEKLLVDWALAHDEVAAIFEDRIYTAVPKSPVFPLLQFQRIGGGPIDRVAWLDNPLVQVDVWGGAKVTARAGMATVLALVASDLPGSHDLGVVGATSVGAMSWLPDTSFNPPKPRYTADVSIWLRP